MYNYSSGRIVFRSAIGTRHRDEMDTQVVTETEGDQRGQQEPIRVAVAGATGFAGQELIRLLARHPHVTITAATGSQATSTPRRLPVAREDLGRHRGAAERRGASRPTPCSWRCPKPRPPSSRRRCSPAGLRVIDLSGAFRLRDDATRAKFYPATAALPKGVAYGLTEFELDAIKHGAPAVESRLLPDRVAARPAAAAARRAAEAGRRHRDRRQVGHLGRRQGGDRSHALFGEPRQRGGVQPVRPSAHAGDGAGARPVGDVRAAPGAARSRHPVEHVCAPRARARPRPR